MGKEVLLNKAKLGDKLDEVRAKCKVIRETDEEIIVEGDLAPELMEMYEGLERMDE